MMSSVLRIPFFWGRALASGFQMVKGGMCHLHAGLRSFIFHLTRFFMAQIPDEMITKLKILG